MALKLTFILQVKRLINGFYIVEWALVNDFSQVTGWQDGRVCACVCSFLAHLLQFNAFGRNLSATVLRDLEIANVVDSVSITQLTHDTPVYILVRMTIITHDTLVYILVGIQCGVGLQPPLFCSRQCLDCLCFHSCIAR